MTDALTRLAAKAGLSPDWTDAFGRPQTVSPDVLRALLARLSLPAETDADVADSLARLEQEQAATTPPLVTADCGQPIALPFAHAGDRVRYRIRLEGGGLVEGEAQVTHGRLHLPALSDAGYHQLEAGGIVTTLAVAPARCFSVGDAAHRDDPRLWALAVQVYGLRRPGDGGIGDFTGLGQFAATAARTGASALVMSPVHAAFSADANHFSPYAPSSRLFLNALHADPAVLFGAEAVTQAVAALGLAPEMAELEAAAQVDWPKAGPLKLALLRHLCAERLTERPDLRADLAAFRRDGGQPLEDHARFEALHAAQFGADPFKWHWRSWPEGLRHPRSPDVERFAHEHGEEVTFHAALQWMAARSLQTAQECARSAGMPIGLIADLAVGAEGGGSQAWGRQEEMLIGATVGAPPDLLNSIGQGWGLAAFSPRGLAASGFAMFRDMLGAVMAHAGGVRIDHVMGLSRLWLIPEGAPPAAGAYLTYPFDDMMRLVALGVAAPEGHRPRRGSRHRAVRLPREAGGAGPVGPPGAVVRAGRGGLSLRRRLFPWRQRGHRHPRSAHRPWLVAGRGHHLARAPQPPGRGPHGRGRAGGAGGGSRPALAGARRRRQPPAHRGAGSRAARRLGLRRPHPLPPGGGGRWRMRWGAPTSPTCRARCMSTPIGAAAMKGRRAPSWMPPTCRCALPALPARGPAPEPAVPLKHHPCTARWRAPYREASGCRMGPGGKLPG